MYFGVQTPSGVLIAQRRSSEVPHNAIAPIPDWAELKDVPERYLKVEDGQVVVKNQDERDAADAPLFDELKQAVKDSVFKKTHDLIEQGYTFDGNVFSLTVSSQASWTAIQASRAVAGDAMFPLPASTRTGVSYVFDDAAAWDVFYSEIFAYVAGRYSEERSQIATLDAIDTVAGLRAYVDPRS